MIEQDFVLAREHEIESLFAVANGYLGTRAALAEGSSLSSPATFVAGVFEKTPGSVVDLLVAPDWTSLATWVDGRTLIAEAGTVLLHRRTLDLRRGLLWRELRYRDPDGRITRMVGLRFASLADRHVLVQALAFCPENYSGQVRFESRLLTARSGEALVQTLDPLAPALRGQSEPCASRPVTVAVRAAGTGVILVMAGETQIRCDSSIAPPQIRVDNTHALTAIDLHVEIGRWYSLHRVVTTFSSRDTEHPLPAAAGRLGRVLGAGLKAISDAHLEAWSSRWKATDIVIEGDPPAQRALRFSCYHLIGAANPDDERVSIGARALTGSAYKGHVFWDTEIYMLPFYTLTHPPSARALLMYRYHTLPAAREKARASGYRGAMYPWESADTGEEVTPPVVVNHAGEVVPVLSGQQEHHITADVAYGVWQYWQATGDDAFFRNAGAEILLETSRFWASRGRMENDARFHIREVIGPDEYHETIDDNAFTNLMAQWNLEHGVEAAALLRRRWPEQWRELAERLAIQDSEIAQWARLAGAMYTGFDPASRLYEQFQGYFGLEDIDLAAYEPRTVAVDVLLGKERTQHSKVVKQADTVMALYLLWERFPAEVREANFRYYEPRTGHGSSLSPSIHALVAARLGDVPLAAKYFRQAAQIDLANNMGNAAGGVHAAALGGLWQAAVFGFAGLEVHDDGLSLTPHLPANWKALRFPLQWRGRQLSVQVKNDPLSIEVQLPQTAEPAPAAGGEAESASAGRAVKLAAGGGSSVLLHPGRRYRSRRVGAGWQDWQEV